MKSSTMTVKGLIIKETKVGEGNKIFTVLTDELGKIQASASGVRSYKSKLSAGCCLFGFSTFELRNGKNMYGIAAADSIYNFYDLRTDIVRLSYASYFCDLVNAVTVEQCAADILRLLLNTMYYLEKNDGYSLIKSVFELKLMIECGFMPSLNSCMGCGKRGVSRFSVEDGGVFCENCGNGVPVSADTINAMRYIVSSEQKKMFAFNISDDVCRELAGLTEKYTQNFTERNLRSLTYLKNLGF